MKKIENGVHEIAGTTVEDLPDEESSTPGITITRKLLHPGGREDLRARNRAIAATYAPLDPGLLSGYVTLGQQVSMMYLKDSGSVIVREGRLLRYQGRDMIIPKGKRASGYWVDQYRILELVPSYNGQMACDASWRRHAELVPDVRQADVDGIPEFDPDRTEESSPAVSAVFLLEHPGFGDGAASGCLFLATEIHPDERLGDTIVDGYFWCPQGAPMESEHGSFTLENLRRWGGRVTNYEPGALTFAQCWDLPVSPLPAYAAVLGLPQAATLRG